MSRLVAKTLILLLSATVLNGCASSARELMPTPVVYQQPGGKPLFDKERTAPRHPDVDLLFITDRAPPTPVELERAKGDGQPLPYGQARARRIAFGSARVRLTPGLTWEGLSEQSQLAERTAAER